MPPLMTKWTTKTQTKKHNTGTQTKKEARRFPRHPDDEIRYSGNQKDKARRLGTAKIKICKIYMYIESVRRNMLTGCVLNICFEFLARLSWNKRWWQMHLISTKKVLNQRTDFIKTTCNSKNVQFTELHRL